MGPGPKAQKKMPRAYAPKAKGPNLKKLLGLGPGPADLGLGTGRGPGLRPTNWSRKGAKQTGPGPWLGPIGPERGPGPNKRAMGQAGHGPWARPWARAGPEAKLFLFNKVWACRMTHKGWEMDIGKQELGNVKMKKGSSNRNMGCGIL